MELIPSRVGSVQPPPTPTEAWGRGTSPALLDVFYVPLFFQKRPGPGLFSFPLRLDGLAKTGEGGHVVIWARTASPACQGGLKGSWRTELWGHLGPRLIP